MVLSSSSLSNPDANSNLSRKRRKIEPHSSARLPTEAGRPRWRTETEQQIYSSKLVDALRHLRRPESPDSTGRAVRETADRVLAVSARGRTRWSRAILAGRLSLRLAHIKKKHKKAAKPAAAADSRVKKPVVQKKQPLLQRKVKVLSRLVPGCRKLPLPNLLEETTDYIAALEMQVKAMTFLTGLLNAGASSAAGSSLADQIQYFSSA
ncbi:transcription factor bHLH149-like [Sesamum indicum]|uniref:Transcription factor bHLH149-like n=1 Tax=Sesamum indicum TaxID=4182 RepID=A0A6I9TRW4_SESIN|nr:transcription factor bHLH149-like [Sesamum indicum]